MERNSPLQKGPIGLLDLFRLKTLGNQPTRFGDLVAPGIDVTDFYGADVLVGGTASSGPNTIPQSAQVVNTIPGRMIALSGTLTVGAAAGTWASLRLYVRVPSVSGSKMIVGSVNFVPIAGAQYTVQSELPLPLILPAGSGMGAEILGNAGGADHSLVFTYLFQQLNG